MLTMPRYYGNFNLIIKIIIIMLYNCSLDSLRGYSHTVPNSIINCPYIMQGGIIMPLANSLQFFDGTKSTTIFESKRFINAIDMKNNFIAIGEKASPGQLISAVMLDTRDLSNGKIFNYQKTEINHISVSADGQFFCSVGSSSDLIEEMTVIQVNNQAEVGTKIFYSRVFRKKQGKVMAVKFSNRDPHFFVLLCVNKVILYRIDEQNQEVSERLAKTSKIRQYTNIIFNPNDTLLYGCSLNGDIAEISIQECKQIRIGPRKRVITKGIMNIKYLEPGMLIITGNEGLMALIQLQQMKLLKEVKLPDDKIISLTQFHNNQAYIASNKAMIYKINAISFHMEVIYTAHSTNINALCFLKGFSQIFGTCSGSDVIVWKTKTLAPILRISIAKITCLSLNFPKNGKYILSGWSDDSIRIFSPKNGKLIHHIRESNLGKVKEMISDEDSTIMICGGQNGMIRMWNLVESKILGLIYGSLAFHLKAIHCLCINPFNSDQLISCCQDGKFAVWSLNKFELRTSFFITNFIKDLYFVDETTIRLAGSGNLIYQCLISDGTIRKKFEVDCTYISGIEECLIESTGETLLFYSGSQNYLTYFDLLNKKIELIKLSSYGQINRIKLTPDKASIIAVTTNGIILKYNIFGITKVIEDD